MKYCHSPSKGSFISFIEAHSTWNFWVSQSSYLL